MLIDALDPRVRWVVGPRGTGASTAFGVAGDVFAQWG
jgi:hypothetical protein